MQTRQFNPIDIDITGQSTCTNPFMARLEGRFESPSGAVLRIPGYCSGEGKWTIRFMPDETGSTQALAAKLDHTRLRAQPIPPVAVGDWRASVLMVGVARARSSFAFLLSARPRSTVAWTGFRAFSDRGFLVGRFGRPTSLANRQGFSPLGPVGPATRPFCPLYRQNAVPDGTIATNMKQAEG